MQTTSSNSTRIAKNTFFLYLRSFFTLLISLYTSRVVLEVLGVVDYGIFNVVATTIGMVSFMNNSMAATYQRYFNYEMGQKNIDKVKSIFKSSLTVQIIYAFIIIIIAETVGLWFLEYKMVIPIDRMHAAYTIYHISIISFIVSLFTSPFCALVIAYEKMNIFAYISVIDAILKLILVVCLKFLTGDKLIIYGIISLFLVLLNLVIYLFVCKSKFSSCEVALNFDKSNIKKLLNFGTWGMIDSLSFSLKSQGLNILLNIFFGPVVNAARGIAYQILTAVNQFITSFQTSFRPQIIKSYSEGNYEYMYKLYYSATKISCYLLWFLSLPIIIETDSILTIWLGNNVPNHTAEFTRIILLTALVSAYSNPTSAIAYATGKIRKFSLTVSILNLFILPAAYLALHLGFSPESAMVVSLLFSIIVQILRLYVVKTLVVFSISDYLKHVVIPTFAVFIITPIIPYSAKLMLNTSIYSCIFVCCLSCVSVFIAVWIFGLNCNEKQLIKSKLPFIRK